MKDLRLLCLKVIYIVLSKYNSINYGTNLWNMLFIAIKPSFENFIQESVRILSKKVRVVKHLSHCLLFLSGNGKPFKSCFISQEKEIVCPQHFCNRVC